MTSTTAYLAQLSDGTQITKIIGSDTNFEWILKPNTDYIYKLENLGDGTAMFLAKLYWYEHI